LATFGAVVGDNAFDAHERGERVELEQEIVIGFDAGECLSRCALRNRDGVGAGDFRHALAGGDVAFDGGLEHVFPLRAGPLFGLAIDLVRVGAKRNALCGNRKKIVARHDGRAKVEAHGIGPARVGRERCEQRVRGRREGEAGAIDGDFNAVAGGTRGAGRDLRSGEGDGREQLGRTGINERDSERLRGTRKRQRRERTIANARENGGADDRGRRGGVDDFDVKLCIGRAGVGTRQGKASGTTLEGGQTADGAFYGQHRTCDDGSGAGLV